MVRSEGEVSVTLLLNGGHSRTLYLRRRDPLLSSLVSSIGEKSYGGGRPARPFNIHLDQGRRSFIFSSTDLVGLVTDPPMLGETETRQPSMAMQRQPSDEPQPEPPVEKSPYVLLENFVDDALHAELLKFAFASEGEFAAGDGRAPLMRGFTRFSGLFRDRLRSLVPQLTTAFGIGEFAIGEVDCALTAQNDGDHVAWNGEDDAFDAAEPAITYAYYFHGEPKAFTGGAFRLYNSRVAGGAAAAEIEPGNNSILLFPSACPHEVLPLCCPSRRFVDGRFAITGSVRRARSA